MKDSHIKIVLTLVLCLSYCFLPKYGFTPFHGSLSGHTLATHLLYPFSHANVFHLLANIVCLWWLRSLHLPVTYIIAVLCSFLPSFSLYGFFAGQGFALAEPTYGFSGIIFAVVGVSWGKVHRFRDMLWRNKWFLIITTFLPHVNFLIHLYCLLLGFLYGFSVSRGSASAKNSVSCDKKSENS